MRYTNTQTLDTYEERSMVQRLRKRNFGPPAPISIYQYEGAPSRKEIVLIIYGGAKGFSQSKCAGMKRILAKAGYIAASFDFRGNPQGHDFYHTGLHTRIEDAQQVLDRLKREYPRHVITVLGISMGGYVATFLAKDERVERLILIAPAAYDPRVLQEKAPFGPRFSEIIRVRNSWMNSDGFTNVRASSKKILVIAFGDDEVVPPAITDTYYAAAVAGCGTSAFATLDEYGHKGNYDGQKLKDLMGVVIPWLKDSSSKLP